MIQKLNYGILILNVILYHTNNHLILTDQQLNPYVLMRIQHFLSLVLQIIKLFFGQRILKMIGHTNVQ